ncbi:SLC13 family permease [Roseicella aerolata]|uniref:SLC13 family permease n=1 Tax=Roseicella aerolata TaxID=2883479 RepID=A0A9X1L964_9PROT|nr:SLC13 family permease [Roseicella aerolata]MCB4823299.1 SLC13 family permease [Roseicella aerolata]
MSRDQALITGILLATLVMFAWGRWRHDMVAMGALLAAVAAGLVPGAEAFAGFGHAAVVTVACVLVLSSGLQSSGAVDALARVALPRAGRPLVSVAALTALGAALSAFMNNVGALALLMPVAIQLAAREGLPPGRVLMPLAFGSILGGMTTLIGTPPNLVVSGFRAREDGAGFAMFDFAPVGVAVALAGVLFVAVAARWLVPVRERRGADAFDTGAYLTEVRATDDSAAVGMTLREIEQALEADDVQVIGLVRHDVRVGVPPPQHRVQSGDILVIEAGPEGLAATLARLGLTLEEDVPVLGDAAPRAAEAREGGDAAPADDDLVLAEYAVLPGAAVVGRSATDIRLRDRYAVNLLAISRQGRQTIARLRKAKVRPGDVLLLQGSPEAMAEFASQFGCVPLADRTLRLPAARQAWTAAGVMVGTIALSASGLAGSAVAFAGGVLAAMALRVVSPRTVYTAVDWTVVVLLGALIPVAGAMETTGTAELLARLILEQMAGGDAVVALVVILVATMTLSDVINNAATAAVMCPIALQTAGHLSVSADAFLMAVAIGASCAFLTPIGHQNNTLILGPGGFRFGDYWRLGLPLEVIVIAVAVPMLLLIWPL